MLHRDLPTVRESILLCLILRHWQTDSKDCFLLLRFGETVARRLLTLGFRSRKDYVRTLSFAAVLFGTIPAGGHLTLQYHRMPLLSTMRCAGHCQDVC